MALAPLVAHAAWASDPRDLDEIDVAALRRWSGDGVVLQVVDTAPFAAQAAVLAAVDGAAAAWNGVGAGPRLAVAAAPSGAPQHPVLLDGANRVGVWSDGDWPWGEGAGAVTLVYAAEGSTEIGEVDVALNPAFAWTVDPAEERGRYDLQNVFVHELGHALGLPDVKDRREASMFYLILRGETLKRDVSSDDEGLLLALYAGLPLERAEGCGAARAPSALALLVLLALLATRRRLVI